MHFGMLPASMTPSMFGKSPFNPGLQGNKDIVIGRGARCSSVIAISILIRNESAIWQRRWTKRSLGARSIVRWSVVVAGWSQNVVLYLPDSRLKSLTAPFLTPRCVSEHHLAQTTCCAVESHITSSQAASGSYGQSHMKQRIRDTSVRTMMVDGTLSKMN